MAFLHQPRRMLGGLHELTVNASQDVALTQANLVRRVLGGEEVDARVPEGGGGRNWVRAALGLRRKARGEAG